MLGIEGNLCSRPKDYRKSLIIIQNLQRRLSETQISLMLVEAVGEGGRDNLAMLHERYLASGAVHCTSSDLRSDLVRCCKH